jgi:hypothetical protein
MQGGSSAVGGRHVSPTGSKSALSSASLMICTSSLSLSCMVTVRIAAPVLVVVCRPWRRPSSRDFRRREPVGRREPDPRATPAAPSIAEIFSPYIYCRLLRPRTLSFRRSAYWRAAQMAPQATWHELSLSCRSRWHLSPADPLIRIRPQSHFTRAPLPACQALRCSRRLLL